MADIDNSGLIPPGWLATLVLVAALGLGVIWLQSGLLGRDAWPIEWLDVEGEIRRTSAEQIRAAAVVHADQGFFAVDLAAVRRAVEELPWIESSEVRRRWPDTLVVSVREHRPVARWNDTHLVNRRGEQFAVPGAAELQGLPWLEGPDARLDEVLELWTLMHRELSAINAGIEHVKLDDRGAWEVRLSSGVALRLGREDPVGRVRRYVKVADELRSLHEFAPEFVDLRHTNGLAVRWPKSELGTRDSEQPGLREAGTRDSGLGTRCKRVWSRSSAPVLSQACRSLSVVRWQHNQQLRVPSPESRDPIPEHLQVASRGQSLHTTTKETNG